MTRAADPLASATTARRPDRTAGRAPRAVDPLADTLRRWGRARRAQDAAHDVHALAERLDDKGCAYGRVTAARLDEVARAYERLETKLNAVLLAVLATLASVMVGFLVQALRGGVP